MIVMWYKEIVVVLTRALQYYSAAQSVSSIAEKLATDDEKEKLVTSTALRGLGYVFTKHLNQMKQLDPYVAESIDGTSLDDDSLIQFLALVDEDFTARRISNRPEDIAEQWMNAYVTQYRHRIAPKWLNNLYHMSESSNPHARPTLHLILKQQIEGLKNDSKYLKLFNNYPGYRSGSQTVDSHLNMVDLLSHIMEDPYFQQFSDGLTTATINVNHYLPFKMLSAFTTDKLLARTFINNISTSRKGLRIIPLPPLDILPPGSMYTRKHTQVISRPLTRSRKETGDTN